MNLQFTKTRKKHNWVRATHEGKTLASFPWPSHPGLPHDLIHCVVESEFRLKHGFWGLVSDGVDLLRINKSLGQATRNEITELSEQNLHELYLSEALVASFQTDFWSETITSQRRRELIKKYCAEWKIDAPREYESEILEITDRKLAHLHQQWKKLEVGKALHLN